MTPFVSVEAFADVYDIVTDDNLAQVTLALEAACDAVREHMCQTINLVAADEVVLAGSDTRALILPELPVVSVASVAVDGTAVTDWTLDSFDAGILWRDQPYWWPRCSKVTVTYTHGYAEADVPAIIRQAAFRLALAEYDRPGAITQETTGPFSVTYADGVSILGQLPVLKRVPMP